MAARRVYLLSPASTSGRRAEILLSPRADFELARRLRSPGGAPLGEVMVFLSGLYFRGKLAYARRFAPDPDAVRVITAGAGLLAPETAVTPAHLRAFARCGIDAANPRYLAPLLADARALGACEAVLLGSIATPKYVDVLHDAFGVMLRFPTDFVGRGDMSRGGLLLRAARAGEELVYRPIDGAPRRGPRPRRLG